MFMSFDYIPNYLCIGEDFVQNIESAENYLMNQISSNMVLQ